MAEAAEYGNASEYGMIHLQGYDFRRDAERWLTDEYSTFFYANQTLQLLENVVDSKQEEPFFLYWSSQAAHEPFQAPKESIDSFTDSITTTDRRALAAVVTLLDDAVGEVVSYLKSSKLWENTVLIVSSDNGGSVTDGASNFPLRFCFVALLNNLYLTMFELV